MISSARISAIAAFCKELREAREYQRISLREIAAMTRLGLDHLQAIEEARWDDIPRAYLRGYLGLYSQAVGMNLDKVLRSFDRLMLPESESDAAILDEAPPLLREPQAVGITRAKIRTTWFAVLSRNRKLLYLLSFFAVIGLFGLLYLTRKIEDRQMIPLTPFSEAVAESRSALTTPLLVVPVDSPSTDAKSAEHWVSWIGTAKGSLLMQRDRESVRRWRFDAYDTIKIQYLTQMSAKVWPAASVAAFQDTARIPPAKTLSGDTAQYLIKPGMTLHPDSAKNNVDSLVKG
jgi:hypothetical protein